MDAPVATRQQPDRGQGNGLAPSEDAGQDGRAVWELRPRLRRDVVFADTGDGALLRHADAALVLKGTSAYRWVSTLVPYLDGGHTVADLCAGLGDARRGMVADIVRTLLDRGMARAVVPEQPTELPAAVRERFRAQIGFLDHYADGPLRRFAAFRSSRVLLAGSGTVALAAAACLLRNGLEAVDLLHPGDGAGVPEQLRAAAADLERSGCPATVRLVPPPAAGLDGDGDRRGGPTKRFDVVLALGDDLGPARLVELTRSAVAGGPALLPLLTVGGLAVLGPVVRPGGAPCWVCAMLRLEANLDAAAVAEVWRAAALASPPSAAGGVTGPVARMLGNTLAFDLFRLRSGGLPAEADGAVLVQDLHTLDTARDRVLPHPACPVCGPGGEGDGAPDPAASAPSAAEPVGGWELDGEALRELQEALLGAHAGVLSGYADGAITQMPVKVGRVRLGPPGRASGAPREVTGFDVETVLAARGRAIQAALLAYVDDVSAAPGALAAVTRPGGRLGSLQAASRVGARVGLGELVTSGGPDGPEDPGTGWVAARSLVSGQACQVPVAAAYPRTGDAAAAVERIAAGAGCAPTLEGAVEAGLVAALAHRALLRAVDGRDAAVPLDAGAFGEDAELGFLARSLGHLGRGCRLLRLPGAAPAATVLAVSDGGDDDPPAWSLGSARSLRDAAHAALRDLTGALQLRHHGEAAADLGDPPLPELDPRALPVGPAADGAAATGAAAAADLVDGLRSRGEDALVVETTTRDLRAVGFVTVRVLLTPEPKGGEQRAGNRRPAQ